MVNPKFAVKDTPKEQYDWATYFFKQGEFQRAADEFAKLTKHYPDSSYSPEAQYYAGRSYEEMAKYYFAYQNYQKTLEDYPYTKRMEEILEREFNIAQIFQSEDTAKLMDVELSLSLERAAEIYKKIVEVSPYSVYADRALYNAASCYRRMQKYDDAIQCYERIINDYPDSKLVSEAKYQMAYAKYEASLGPEYDQESTEEALKEFKKISRTTAVPQLAKEAERVMSELETKKANSILKIASFYERQGHYASAVMYYKEVVGKFPNTAVAKQAQEKINHLEKRIKK